MKNKNISKLDIFLIVLLVFVIGFLIYYIIVNDNKISKEDDPSLGEVVLTDDEVLKVGYDLFNQVGNIYLSCGGNVEKQNNNGNWQNAYYRKNSDGSFSLDTTSYFDGIGDNVPYVKLLINDVHNLLRDVMLQDFYDKCSIVKYQGDYYHAYEMRERVFSYANTELEVVNVSNNRLVFNAKSYYYLVSSEAFDRVSYMDALTETRVNKFILMRENGFWKVEEFHMPY